MNRLRFAFASRWSPRDDPSIPQDRGRKSGRRECRSLDVHYRATMTQGHQRRVVEEVDVALGGAAVSHDAVFRFIEPSPKMVVARQEQRIDPSVASGLDDLLGLGVRLAR